MDVIENVFSLMKEKRFQKQEFAAAWGVSASAITSLEQRKREIKVSELPIIARILGVREIDILTYPDVYEKKSENNYILSEPLPIYEKTEPKENPYKLLYELQKEMTEIVQENERLKNGAAIGRVARTG